MYLMWPSLVSNQNQKKDIPKRKLQANKSNEYGYKNPQQNIGKLNLKIYEKHYLIK